MDIQDATELEKAEISMQVGFLPFSLLLLKLICYFSSLNLPRNFEKQLNLVSYQLKQESELSSTFLP